MAKPCSVQFSHSASRGSKCQLWEADYRTSGNQLNRVDSDTSWNDTECKRQIDKCPYRYLELQLLPVKSENSSEDWPWTGEESTKEALGRTNLAPQMKGSEASRTGQDLRCKT